jgi:hypothetical protein
MFHEVFYQRFFVSCAQSSFFAVYVPSQAQELVKSRPTQPSRNIELLKALIDEQLDLNNLEREVNAKTYSSQTTRVANKPAGLVGRPVRPAFKQAGQARPRVAENQAGQARPKAAAW